MHNLEVFLGGGVVALGLLVVVRLLRRGVKTAGAATSKFLAERAITLDDFEPTEVQADQIRLAVASLDRQRTPAITKPDPKSPGGFTYDYDGPRAEAGRLFGIVYRGEIAMFYQWRGNRISEDHHPRRAALKAFWNQFPEARDEDGWPIKPEKVFEINPGQYDAPNREYVPVFGEKMHESLKRELGA